jgi:hypothetical protein
VHERTSTARLSEEFELVAAPTRRRAPRPRGTRQVWQQPAEAAMPADSGVGVQHAAGETLKLAAFIRAAAVVARRLNVPVFDDLESFAAVSGALRVAAAFRKTR